eukprot:8830449-Pyramimonas_sp.AAC.1
MRIALRSVRGVLKWLLQAHASHLSHGRVATFRRPRKMKVRSKVKASRAPEAHLKHVFTPVRDKFWRCDFCKKGARSEER